MSNQSWEHIKSTLESKLRERMIGKMTGWAHVLLVIANEWWCFSLRIEVTGVCATNIRKTWFTESDDAYTLSAKWLVQCSNLSQSNQSVTRFILPIISHFLARSKLTSIKRTSKQMRIITKRACLHYSIRITKETQWKNAILPCLDWLELSFIIIFSELLENWAYGYRYT